MAMPSKVPCLVCNTLVAKHSLCSSVTCDLERVTLFLLRHLLEIPKSFVHFDNYWEMSGDNGNEKCSRNSCSRFLATCEQCTESIKEARLIHSELGELAKRFRGIQKKIVETFKNCIGARSTGETEVLAVVEHYRELVNNCDYHGFGFPFILQDEQVVGQEQSPSLTELAEVVVKQEEEDTCTGNQEILLIFPEDEVQLNQMDSEEDDDDETGYQANQVVSECEEDDYQVSPLNSDGQEEEDDSDDYQDSDIGSEKDDDIVQEDKNKGSCPNADNYRVPNLLSSFICKKCLQRFPTKEQLDEHDKQIHLKEEKGPFPCPLEGCTRMYTCSAKFPQHFRLHHRKPPFICKDCKTEFSNPNQVLIHHKQTHPTANQQQPIIKPKKVKRPNSPPEKAIKVIKRRPKKPRPQKPKERRNPHLPFPCPLCHHSLKKFSSLRAHMKRSHPNNSIPLDELRLKYFSPSTQPALPEVRKSTHPKHKYLGISTFELEYPYIICKRNSQGKFPCPWTEPSPCPKIFASKAQLQRHIKVKHLNLPLFTCSWSGGTEGGGSVCGKVFASRKSYLAHYDEHRGTPGYKCDECDMTFYRRNPFVRHQQRMHSSQTFICEICGRSFPCKDHLYMHKSQKHRDKSKGNGSGNEKNEDVGGLGIICDLCGIHLKYRASLKKHMEIVHEKVPGKYSCHLCDKRFRQTIHLNVHLWGRHQLKVEGFQPKEKVARMHKFQCPVKGCRKLFMKKENLEKHGIEVHGEDGNKPGPWNCKHCGKNFFVKVKWQKCEKLHESKGSTEEKCEICGKGFQTKEYLKYHQKHTHKMQLEDNRGWRRGK